jgi:hypothetical protein
MTFDDLVRRCKGSVYLTVNEHRSYYQSVEDWLKEQRLQRQDSLDEITPELLQRMIEIDTVYEVHFYPRNPVGFDLVFGTSLQEVLDKAEESLNADTGGARI